jgi:hypothetical protein
MCHVISASSVCKFYKFSQRFQDKHEEVGQDQHKLLQTKCTVSSGQSAAVTLRGSDISGWQQHFCFTEMWWHTYCYATQLKTHRNHTSAELRIIVQTYTKSFLVVFNGTWFFHFMVLFQHNTGRLRPRNRHYGKSQGNEYLLTFKL